MLRNPKTSVQSRSPGSLRGISIPATTVIMEIGNRNLDRMASVRGLKAQARGIYAAMHDRSNGLFSVQTPNLERRQTNKPARRATGTHRESEPSQLTISESLLRSSHAAIIAESISASEIVERGLSGSAAMSPHFPNARRRDNVA